MDTCIYMSIIIKNSTIKKICISCILLAKDKNFLQKKRRKIEYKNIRRWS